MRDRRKLFPVAIAVYRRTCFDSPPLDTLGGTPGDADTPGLALPADAVTVVGLGVERLVPAEVAAAAPVAAATLESGPKN